MNHIYLLLGRNEALNKWLGEHPTVLGGLMLAVGLALAGSGIYEMRTGVTRDKYGNVVEGAWGKTLTVLRVLIGTGFSIFGIYKLVMG